MVGVLATIGLALLGVPFFAVLGLIAGIFEILPFVGPIIGAIPAILVAVIERPILGLWTLILFIVIQQVENAVLVPRISGKAVELHPALIVLVLIIGSQVAGLTGAILAVPVTAILRDVFKYLYLRSRRSAGGAGRGDGAHQFDPAAAGCVARAGRRAASFCRDADRRQRCPEVGLGGIQSARPPRRRPQPRPRA